MVIKASIWLKPPDSTNHSIGTSKPGWAVTTVKYNSLYFAPDNGALGPLQRMVMSFFCSPKREPVIPEKGFVSAAIQPRSEVPHGAAAPGEQGRDRTVHPRKPTVPS